MHHYKYPLHKPYFYHVGEGVTLCTTWFLSEPYLISIGNNVTVAGLFSNNVATTNGGAIYTDSSFSIVANNSETVFTGNTANALSNAIYVNASTSVTIRMNATNNGTIRFDDAIQGANKYNGKKL